MKTTNKLLNNDKFTCGKAFYCNV